MFTRDDLYTHGVTTWALGILKLEISVRKVSRLRGALLRSPVDVRISALFKICVTVWMSGDLETNARLASLAKPLVEELQVLYAECTLRLPAAQVILLLSLSLMWPVECMTIPAWLTALSACEDIQASSVPADHQQTLHLFYETLGIMKTCAIALRELGIELNIASLCDEAMKDAFVHPSAQHEGPDPCRTHYLAKNYFRWRQIHQPISNHHPSTQTSTSPASDTSSAISFPWTIRSSSFGSIVPDLGVKAGKFIRAFGKAEIRAVHAVWAPYRQRQIAKALSNRREALTSKALDRTYDDLINFTR